MNYRIQATLKQQAAAKHQLEVLRCSLLYGYAMARHAGRNDVAALLAEEWHERFHGDIRQETGFTVRSGGHASLG